MFTKMKKIIAFLLAAVITVGVVPLYLGTEVNAATSGTTGDCTWTLNGTELTISGNGAMADYTSTGPWGNAIRSVVIENGVTSIGNRAFANCFDLSNVVMGNSVVNIGKEAFLCCLYLFDLPITNSVVTIGDYAFQMCDPFSVYIPAGVTEIGEGAFSYCWNLNRITVAEDNPAYSSDHRGVLFDKNKSVLIQAPYRLSGSYVIPDSVHTVCDDAFFSCSDLEKITIPIGVTNIGYGAFSDCRNLCDIYYCGEEADRANMVIGSINNSLSNATWHYSICFGTTEHEYEWITDRENSCGVAGIKHEECAVCHARRSESTPIAPSGNHSYDNACDTSCNVCSLEREVIHAYEWVIDRQSNCGVAGIKHEECAVCHARQSENTPIAPSGNHSYDNVCDTSCNVCSQEREAIHDYEWVIDRQSNCGVAGIKHEECAVCHARRSESTPIAPHGIHTYYGTCDAICDVCGYERNVIHGYRWVIDRQSNCGIEGIKHLECDYCHEKLYEGTSIPTIGEHKYEWVIDKDNTCVQDGIKHEECTVCHAKRSENTQIEADGIHVWRAAFCSTPKTCVFCGITEGEALGHTWLTASCTTAKTCTTCGLSEGEPAWCHYENMRCTACGRAMVATGTCGEGLTWVLSDDGTLTILGNGEMSFYLAPWYGHLEKIYRVEIANGVTNIGKDAFNKCINLSSVSIPESVTEIGTRAFYNCIGLYSIDIPDGVKTIGEEAFAYCYYLEDVKIGDGVTTIGRYGFYKCQYMFYLTLGYSIKTIDEYAFDLCYFLSEVTYNGVSKNDITIRSGNYDLNYARWYCVGCKGAAEHLYDDCYDTVCNRCSRSRSVTHSYIWVTEKESTCIAEGIKCEICTDCYSTRSENTVIPSTGRHVFSNAGDTECNTCGQTFFQIIFDIDGNTNTLIPVVAAPGQLATLPDYIPTRYGYSFAGWSTEKNGIVEHKPGDTCSLDRSITLYAQWDLICPIYEYYECYSCSGRGRVHGTGKCNSCNGSGQKLSSKSTCYVCDGYGIVESATKCSTCGGDGEKGPWCSTCGRSWPNEYCRINGHSWYYTVKCDTCRGTGHRFTQCTRCDGLGELVYYDDCYTCSGSGKNWVGCTRCSGSGSLQRNCSKCKATGIYIREYVSAPDKPVIESINSSTVVLMPIANGEYSLDGINWQESAVFEGLESGKEYNFYQRYAKTDKTHTSDSSESLTATVHDHIFDGDCDGRCNICEYERTPMHDYSEEWTFDGEFHWHECNNCKDRGDIRSHIPGEGADCTTDQICTQCDAVLVSALGHISNADVTCTEDQICAACGEVLAEARGHLIPDKASCTEDKICSTCNEVIIPATEHTLGSAATCNTDQVCTVCKEVLERAYGHDYVDSYCTKCSQFEGLADIDGDGQCTAKDANLFKKYIVGISSEIDDKRADINGDGNMDAKDYNIMKLIISGAYRI